MSAMQIEQLDIMHYNVSVLNSYQQKISKVSQQGILLRNFRLHYNSSSSLSLHQRMHLHLSHLSCLRCFLHVRVTALFINLEFKMLCITRPPPLSLFYVPISCIGGWRAAWREGGCSLELQPKVREDFTNEEGPSQYRAFSWLKAPTNTLTFQLSTVKIFALVSQFHYYLQYLGA